MNLNISSGKGHNPWLAKSRMFGETIAEHGTLYMFFTKKEKKSIKTKNWNRILITLNKVNIPIVFELFSDKQVKDGVGKKSQPRLAKSRMFVETI